jgi:hypothetical protein
MADLVVVNEVGFKRRNPWGIVLLAIVTIGVYYVVWWYKINNELNNYGIKTDPVVATLAVTIGGLAIVPPYVSQYKCADRILQAQERSGATERIAPVLGLVLFLFVSAFAMPYYQSQLNKVWDALAASGAEVRPA